VRQNGLTIDLPAQHPFLGRGVMRTEGSIGSETHAAFSGTALEFTCEPALTHGLKCVCELKQHF